MTRFSTLEDLRATTNVYLERGLPEGAPPAIYEATRYSLIGGGKRFRPVLCLATAEAVAARDGRPLDEAVADALPGACALEFIHTYSLVHDDLPAMDDDMYRRGQLTTHAAHGDGLAILAGDALLTLAFWLLTLHCTKDDAARNHRRIMAIQELADAAGPYGMVGGQTIDLVAAGKVKSHPATLLGADELFDMHHRKTGALLSAATSIGAILAGGDEETIAEARMFGQDIGLAFQIYDDILDVEGTAAQLGKTPGKDAASDKPTFVSVFGMDVSRKTATDVIDRAKGRLTKLNLDGRLPEIAEWTISRKG